MQALEFVIAHYLVLLNVTPGDEEEAYRQLDSSFKVTMGRLIKKLRGSVHIHPEIEGRLLNLTAERNWLAHKIYRQHHTDIHDEQKFTQLLERINTLGEESINTAKELSILCREWCIAHGIKEQDIDSETVKRFNRRWNT